MTPAFKWTRVLAFFSLIVMTTAMAASPVRDALWPLASRQLARLTPTAPQPLANDVSSDVARSGFPGRDPATTPLAEPDQFAARSASAATAGRQPFTVASAPAASSMVVSADELEEALSPGGGSSRFDVGPWRSSPATAPARAGSASLRRSNGFATGAGWNGASSDARGDVRGGGNAGGRTGGTGSSPSSSSANVPAAPASSEIFTEYQSPLTQAGSSTGSAGAGSLTSLTAATVSSSPEPSTLLLFGTGLAAVARGLRNRLRTAR